jgi:GNAT superfamily N-acetyltransferase
LLVSPNPDTIEAMDVATDLREAGIHIRGARVWTEWVGELADYRRKDISVVIDEALEEYAKRHKFGKIPPKRTQTKRDGKSLT